MAIPDSIMIASWYEHQCISFVLNPAAMIFILCGLVVKYVRAPTYVPLSVHWYITHVIEKTKNNEKEAQRLQHYIYIYR